MGTEYALAVDVVAGLLVVTSAYLAMVRGFFRELFALLSWGVAFVIAFAFAPSMKPVVEALPGVGRYFADCQIAMLAAFILTFGFALLVLGVVIWLFTGRIRDTMTSVADQAGGFVFGALRGLVLVAVIYIAYLTVVPKNDQFAFVEEANSIGLIRGAAGIVQSVVPDTVPSWLEGRVNQLLGACEDA